ncbi:AfsR/SARP family transcriptional regulator [Saccharothrix australiensis]|uniref:NB-ARC domain-containing protein n=1 Tax=Saccharothrix australiensis TaxID=2072 RepID=A0A495W3I1_9PSEU|nr:tetratricopeptide repeat protein [Saccharothrix australiensis]RKT56049.1 NB-ARC domain-containing protein [Saccharothrix australiensis]
MGIHYKILGHTQVLRPDGFTDVWGAPKDRGVLAVLLLNIGRAVPVRTLAEWVWADGKSPRDPAATLSTYTARIRAALKRFELPGQLRTEVGGYRFEVDPAAVDFHAFQRTVRTARRLGKAGDHENACELVASALEWWDGDPLADLDTDRAANWRRVVIRDEWLSANDALLYGLYQLGEYEDMLRLVKVAQIDHDTDVLLAKRRLQALYALRRKEEAVQYLFDFYGRAKAADDPERADELRRFHDSLLAGPEHEPVPPRTGDVVVPPRHLPYDIDDFAGHADLLAELDGLLTDRPKPRLIALDGLPGVGKTTLAVHWAHRVRDRFPNGFWFVNLNGFGDGPSVTGEEVVTGLLEALRVSIDSLPTTEVRRAKLRDLLSTRQLLLVLDNAADAAHVEGLLPLVSSSVVVVTSRVRLSELTLHHGARCFTVPPFDRSLAAGWLRDRLGLRAAREPEAVDHLASLAAGLPLALGIIGEYVAAQPHKPLRDFVDRLRASRAILGLEINGGRAMLSVRAVFDCSYRALDPAVRRLFRLLGLYPGLAIPTGVAAALVGLRAEEVHDQLQSLVWARLLEAREGDRYALHDLLRDFAAECVDRDEEEDGRDLATRRMLDWFLHTSNNADRRIYAHRESVPMLELSAGVTPLVFDDAESAMDWCVRERGELSAVCQYAAANGFDEHLWRLTNAQEVLMRLGFRDEVVHGLRAAVEAARSAGDRFGEAGSLANLGFALSRFNEHEEADRCYRAAYTISSEIDDRIGVAVALRNMAERRAMTGDTIPAFEMFERALAIARAEKDLDTEAGVLHRMGEAMRLSDRLGEAIAQLNLAWSLRERIGDRAGAAATLASMAAAHHQQGDHYGALGIGHRASLELRQVREIGLESQVCVTLAAVHRDLGDLRKAGFYAVRAVELAETARDARRQASAADVLAQVRWRQGAHLDAKRYWEIAHDLYAALGDSRAFGISAQLTEYSEPEVPPGRVEGTVGDSSPVRGS